MKAAQRGLTLIELLVAMALTAVVGVLLAALVNGWVKVRERLEEPGGEPQVLELCMALERRFDALVLRQLYEQRLNLLVSADLYAADKPRWQLKESLAPVERATFSFYQGTRWLAFPSTVAA